MSKKWVLSKLWNLHSKKYYAVFENYIVENYLKLWKNVHNILSMKKSKTVYIVWSKFTFKNRI